MFERPILKTVNQRITSPRKFIQVITGPRQVGKTTLVHQLLPKLSFPSLYFSADDAGTQGSVWIINSWESARYKMHFEESREIVLILDEIQKIPNWSETVKRLWDEDSLNNSGLKVILLGSSSLQIQQGLSESLTGRFEKWYLGHWSLDEMHQAFGWEPKTYAWFGGYPGSAEIIGEEWRWKNYIRHSFIDTAITRDILLMTRIHKPSVLKNLFELGCSLSGQILSLTKILGQLHEAGNTTTLSHYLNLLNTAGMLGSVEKYSASVVRKRASPPKFQVHNNALLAAQKTEKMEDVVSQPKEWGRVVESAVGAHLLNASMNGNFSLYYWREHDKEVDFVLSNGTKLIGIEVKTNETSYHKGSEEFVKRFYPSKMYLVDNKNISWSDLLRTDPMLLF